ncbi:MAG: carboxymuconolactone decarboxylase family protein [Parafilimonas sp.]|nr:carboxymuconolactone decarboxylase family protein [Parafilimonas sp.]
MERISFNAAPAGAYQAMKQLQDYVDNCGLDQQLLELIRFRISQINSCAYCLDMHFKEAVEMGETPLRLFSLSAWRETPYYTPKEEAVLAFAETLTKLPADERSDNIHEELNKYFSKHEIANLTMAVVAINGWNRITRSFGTIPGKYKVPHISKASQN